MSQQSRYPFALASMPDTAGLCLVSCVSEKQCGCHPAKELYTSNLFKKSRKLVELKGWPWFILSAKHGLVHPDDKIEKYDKALKKSDREAWANKTIPQLDNHLGDVNSVVILAGEDYFEFISKELDRRGIVVYIPMIGMGNERRKWLKEQIESIERSTSAKSH